MELVLTDEEFYDLFKSLHFAIGQLPEIVGHRKDLHQRLVAFYRLSPQVCRFVIRAEIVEPEE